MEKALREGVPRNVMANDHCNQDCKSCLPQFIPFAGRPNPALKTRRIGDEQAKSVLESLTTTVKRDWSHVRDRLGLYGDTILTKWQKSSKAKREAAVLEVQPDLYGQKYPEQRLTHQELPEMPFIDPSKRRLDLLECSVPSCYDPTWFSKSQRNALLLPYLNVETIVEDPNRLLGLLFHRSNSLLDDWVSFDVEQMRFSYNNQWLSDQLHSGCVILHGEHYGRLVAWDRDQCHGWLKVGYAQAKLVLEAQSVLYGFLRKIVNRLITPGLSKEGSSIWTAFFQHGLRASGEVEFWSTYYNQPFSAPPVFEPKKHLEQLEAQLSATTDHIQLLQTDPAYLQRCNEGPLNLSSGTSNEVIWDIKAYDVVLCEPLKELRTLQVVVDQCAYVSSLHEAHRTELQPFGSLPKQYEHGVAILASVCMKALDHCRALIRHLVLTSPGFAGSLKCYVDCKREIHARFNLKGLKGEYKQEIDSDVYQESVLYREDPLLWVFVCLVQNHGDATLESKSLLLRILDDQMADPKQRRRISEPIRSALSVYCRYHSIVHAIRHMRPRIRETVAQEWWSYTTEMLFSTMKCFGLFEEEPKQEELRKVSKLLHQFCKETWPRGKKDRAWLEKASSCRCQLAELWAEVRLIVERMCLSAKPKNPFEQWNDDADLALYSADLDPKYEAVKKAEIKEVDSYVQGEKEARNAAEQQTWGDDIQTRPRLHQEKKSKYKTRSKNAAMAVTKDFQALTLAPAPTASTQTRIKVRAESIRIFARMFPAGGEAEPKGLVQWKQVVTALTDAGFTATHCGGSAVSFEAREDAPLKGAIVFHKPHPETTVDAIMLRIMAGRLRKWFHWERDTFVLREKTEA